MGFSKALAWRTHAPRKYGRPHEVGATSGLMVSACMRRLLMHTCSCCFPRRNNDGLAAVSHESYGPYLPPFVLTGYIFGPSGRELSSSVARVRDQPDQRHQHVAREAERHEDSSPLEHPSSGEVKAMVEPWVSIVPGLLEFDFCVWALNLLIAHTPSRWHDCSKHIHIREKGGVCLIVFPSGVHCGRTGSVSTRGRSEFPALSALARLKRVASM